MFNTQTPEQIKEIAANKPPSKRKKRRAKTDDNEGESEEDKEEGEGEETSKEEAEEEEQEINERGDAPQEEFLAPEAPSNVPVPEKIRHTEEGEELEEEGEGKEGEQEEEEEEEDTQSHEEKSVFHGESMVDYQGRSFLSPPSHLKSMPHQCYLPKKLLHTW